MKKVVSILLALTMLFALGVTALALEPGENPGLVLGGSAIPPTNDPDCAAYVVTEPEATDEVTVTFIMEAPNEYWDVEGAFYFEAEVSLTADEAQTFNLVELLEKVEEDYDEFSFDIQSYTVDGTTLYDLVGVTHDDTTFEPDSFDLWGWEFRINDLFPVVPRTAPDGYEGTYLNQTYISDGDVIHFFLDYPATVYGFNYATSYIRIVPTNAEVGSVSVQLQGQKVDYENVTYTDADGNTRTTLQLQVNNYEDFATSTVVYLYNEAGVLVTSGATDANGQVTLSNSGIAAGNYVLRTDSVLQNDDPLGEWDECLFTQTSGYKTITIS